jgi:hypothetical protein
MNEQQERALTEGLRALADRTKTTSASPHVERAVLAEMARVHDRRLAPDATPLRFVALAAGLLLAVTIATWLVRSDVPAGAAQLITPSGFIELPNIAALPEMESASIVRVSLPPSALPQYGVSIVAGMTGASVEAELLVAQDGQPRAIRLVPDSDIQSSRPMRSRP